MKWTFRSKLMTAFLLFGLVPTLIMTFVTNQATDQLTDAAAPAGLSSLDVRRPGHGPIAPGTEERGLRTGPGPDRRRPDRGDVRRIPQGVHGPHADRPGRPRRHGRRRPLPGRCPGLVCRRAEDRRPLRRAGQESIPRREADLHRRRHDRPGGRGPQPHPPAGEGRGQARGVCDHLGRTPVRRIRHRST